MFCITRAPQFPVHQEESAPEKSQEALAKTKQSFGMIPNLERVMATAPALVSSYSHAWEQFTETSLSPIERQVVYQTANFENDCEYCVPWHTLLSEQSGMEEHDVAALRSGATLSNKRLEVLRQFARRLLHTRAKITEAELLSFYEVGFEPQHVLEVILGLSIKLMSNFTNSVAGTPLDKMVESRRWVRPKISASTEEPM